MRSVGSMLGNAVTGIPGIFRRLEKAVNRRLPIRARLTSWYVFLLSIILIAFSAFLFFRLALNSFQDLQSLLSAHSQQVIASLEIENGYLKWSEPSSPSHGAVAVYDRNGLLIKTAGSLPAQAFLNKSEGRSWLSDHLIQWSQPKDSQPPVVIQWSGQDWLSLTTQVKEGSRVLGYVQVARPLAPIEEGLHQLFLLLATTVPATLLVAVAVGMFLAQRALSPIDQIVRTARSIGQSNLSQRLNWDGPQDELGRLALTFDEMLNRLEEAFERQRQFTADASHELRTPISVIRAQAESTLDQHRDEASYREALSQIVKEAERMTYLTNQLLTLARSDADKEILETEPCDLSELIQAVAAEMQTPAKAKGISLESSIAQDAESLLVNGDQTRLTQLVMNLVDNAIKYTPGAKNGYTPQVKLSLNREGFWARLDVCDNGAGIPPADLPHIFERFYRVDKARSRQSGGTGLGLAIAQWIAESHGGRIEVTSRLGQGTTFTVFLPLET